MLHAFFISWRTCIFCPRVKSTSRLFDLFNIRLHHLFLLCLISSVHTLFPMPPLPFDLFNIRLHHLFLLCLISRIFVPHASLLIWFIHLKQLQKNLQKDLNLQFAVVTSPQWQLSPKIDFLVIPWLIGWLKPKERLTLQMGILRWVIRGKRSLKDINNTKNMRVIRVCWRYAH